MKPRITFRPLPMYMLLALGITVQALGVLFSFLPQADFRGDVAPAVVGSRLLWMGSLLALSLPTLFVVTVIATTKPEHNWFRFGRWAPASWCSYWSADQQLRYTQGPALPWPILAYIRARFMALESDFYAPTEYGVMYTVIDVSHASGGKVSV